MPVHLASTAGLSTSRRQFLAGSAAALGSLALLRTGWGADAVANPHRIALLSDTHIPERPDVAARDVNMTANLQQVVKELIALPEKPSGVLINGDCAYLSGLHDDYVNLASCVAPLAEAGLPLHLTMGNHDDRDMLYQVMAAARPDRPLVQSKHVTLLETPRTNWFLLDSLMQVNVVTGLLGEEQRRWLAAALDARQDKPAVVVAHHTPQFQPPDEGRVWTGIQDTADLMEILQSRPHVKAFVFGHSHDWNVSQQNGLHLINLPPVAYVFGAGKPNGWVLAEMLEDGLRLELRTLDEQHPRNGEVVDLAWRPS